MVSSRFLIFLSFSIISCLSCKKSQDSAVSNTDESALLAEITLLEKEYADISARENALKEQSNPLLASNPTQNTGSQNQIALSGENSGFALEGDSRNPSEKRLQDLQTEIDTMEVQKQEILLAMKKLQVKAGKLSNNELILRVRLQDALDAQGVAIDTKTQELSATKKLNRNECRGVYRIQSVSTPIRDSDSGFRTGGFDTDDFLVCTLSVHACEDSKPYPYLAANFGQDITNTVVTRLNRANVEAVIGKNCPCNCLRQ